MKNQIKIQETTTTNLTEKERVLLNSIAKGMDELGSGWLHELADESHETAGVLGSLIKKGLCTSDKDDEGEYVCYFLYITEAGAALTGLEKIDGEWVARGVIGAAPLEGEGLLPSSAVSSLEVNATYTTVEAGLTKAIQDILESTPLTKFRPKDVDATLNILRRERSYYRKSLEAIRSNINA